MRREEVMSECKHHVSFEAGCTLCRIVELEAENAKLKEVIMKTELLADLDDWPTRYPRVYGRLVAAMEMCDG